MRQQYSLKDWEPLITFFAFCNAGAYLTGGWVSVVGVWAVAMMFATIYLWQTKIIQSDVGFSLKGFRKFFLEMAILIPLFLIFFGARLVINLLSPD